MQDSAETTKRSVQVPVLGSGLRLVLAGASAMLTLAVAAPAFASSGNGVADGANYRCPSDMALVGKSCVDKYEGSLVEVTADGKEVPFSAHMVPNGHAVKAKSLAGVTPQAHISMVEGQRACKAAGKRLCHAGEWKNACRGPEKTQYPYGNSRVPGACVDTGRTSPVQKLKGGRYDHTSMNDPALNQLANTVEPTGATSTCTNSYGVHDMVGNVHEWADDGAFHGGYYLDTKINGEGCSYKTTAHAPNYYDYSTGFRCCADADAAPADDEPNEHEDGTEPVAEGTAPAGEGMSSALAKATTPDVEAVLRDASTVGGVQDGNLLMEASAADLAANRISNYPS